MKKDTLPQKNSCKKLTCQICKKEFIPKHPNKKDSYCYDKDCINKYVYKKNRKQINDCPITREKSRKWQKKWNEKNPEKLKQYHKKYVKNNREKINAKNREYIKEYNKREDVRIANNLRAGMHRILKKQNTKKSNKTYKLIGCTIEEFKQHIERQFSEGMSWSNYGEWHVDHIKPVSLFDLTQEVEQLKAFHYSNCQPLWAADNKSKGNRYCQG